MGLQVFELLHSLVVQGLFDVVLIDIADSMTGVLKRKFPKEPLYLSLITAVAEAKRLAELEKDTEAAIASADGQS